MEKTFIVSGAASGIGLTLCKRLLKSGAKVCGCDINEVALKALFADELDDNSSNLMVKKLDVRHFDEWQQVVDDVIQQWQKVDVLCNIAGILKDNWVKDIEVPSDVDLHFDINVKGTIFGVQSVLENMRQNHNGHIINIASMAALSPVPGLSLYSASKFAIRSYSLAAGIELSQYGIAVTTICPDAVQTPMLDQQKDKEQAALTFSGNRTLSVDEVVNTIVDVVLVKRPLEVVLPFKRGVIAKIANIFPQTTSKYVGAFQKQGRKRQSKSKA